MSTRPAPRWQMPDLDEERRVVAGVAAGIAREAGVDPLVIRIGFVVTTLASPWGVVLYLGLWGLMAWRRTQGFPPPAPSQPKGADPTMRLVGVVLVQLGVVALARVGGPGLGWGLVVPVGVATTGVLLAWHHGRGNTSGPVDAARVLIGASLAVAGAVSLLVINVDTRAARDLSVALLVAGAGMSLLLAPWARRMLTDLTAERAERIRSQERAAVAAHLHDSVLQTLALIQRHAEDPTQTMALARRQERELRSWLYEGGAPVGSLRRGLAALTDEIERDHGITVEVVVVGDADAAPEVDGVVAAAREAVVNAARHAGVDRVDVYAEVRTDRIELFVRDTGRGFEPSSVPAHRRGIADSIRGRMERLGGSATVSSTPGGGTEVELRVPRTAGTGNAGRPPGSEGADTR